MKSMEVRKLRKEEHIRTRKLWEEIFTEDTPEFLDYYYSVKAKDNEIYVIEDGDRIVSMLHLNPYEMRVNNQIYRTHYIVAVATNEAYRKQGLMRQLLNHAIQVMEDRGEPFTFLMPASAAIYKPFGFEYIYEQEQGKVKGKRCVDASVAIEHAKVKHCEAIADFANQILRKYDIVTWRNASYYQTLLSELASEEGGILLVKRGETIEGVFCYTKGEKIIIREPLFYHEEDLQYAICEITGNETEEVLCVGYGEETKPMIMAKILHSEINMDMKKAKVFLNEVV